AHPLLPSSPTRRSSDLALPLIRTGPSSPERPARQSSPVAMRCPARWVPRLVPCRMDSLPATGYRGETLAIAGHWARAAQTSQRRSEEHTSELQSPYDLV